MTSNIFPDRKPWASSVLKYSWRELLFGLLVYVVSVPAFSASVTLQPVADTSLFETTPENNLGVADLASGTTANGEKSRALMRFDFSGQVPGNATIISAELTLRVTKAPSGAVSSTFGLHRVLQAWGEGGKGGLIGNAATTDEATWNARFFPDTLWSVPGAAAPADFVAKASATKQIAGVASYSFDSTVDLVSDIQGWMADPKSHFGWILISQSEATPKTARRFGSLEVPATAPTLVIQFSEPTPAVAPSFTTQPVDQKVAVGGSVAFFVKAAGTAPLSYQWKFKNDDLRGAASDTLTLNNVQPSQEGNYSVTVTGPGGTATSRIALLSFVSPPTGGKRWTLMVYGHGDHNLSGSLVADMQEMEAAGSGPDFNVVLQADFDAKATGNVSGGLPASLASGVTRFLMQQDSDPRSITSVPVERLPESMNMDDPAVLTQFITWAAQKYPADRYGLVLWNHGGQWEGFGGDSQDGTLEQPGNLTTAQIRSAVGAAMQTTGIQKWEFVAFDTCLMGGAEVLTDFVPLTDVFIACPELDYGDGWDYAAAFDFLKANPGVSALDFGRAEAKTWEAHHLQEGKDSDLQLAAHAVYDLTKYAVFEQRFNEFGSLLSQIGATRTTVLPRLRLETTQYSLGGVQGIGQPTDYIDLGEFADRLVAEVSTTPALKAAASSLTASIDTLVVAKVRGAKKLLTHALSVYYPVAGSRGNAGYSGLTISSKPGSTWSQFLLSIADDRAGDRTAPDVDSRLSASFSASTEQPVNVKVPLVSGADAYGLYASIVDNRFTGKANEFVYLGEVLSVLVNGIGTHTVPWNATLPMLSSSVGANAVVLGGFFDDVGSDILVSFADYVPPGSAEQQFVILLTQLKGGKAKVISVLDGDEHGEGLAPRGIDVQPGGTLTPAYYMERRSGEDPSKWQSEAVVGKSSVVIPANGLAGLTVTFTQVPDGVYAMEVQVVDLFGNESQVLTYSIAVGQTGSSPALRVQTGNTSKFVLSWSASDTGFVLESNATASPTGWTPVAPGSVTSDGTDKAFTDTLTDSAKFYRLKKN